jgi:hypothetical protein
MGGWMEDLLDGEDDSGQPSSDSDGMDWASDPAQIEQINEQNRQAREQAEADGGPEADMAGILYPEIDPANPYAVN